MLAQEEPLVAGVDDEGVLPQSVGIQPIHQLAHAVVDTLHTPEVVLHVALVFPPVEVASTEHGRLAIDPPRHLGGHLVQPALAIRWGQVLRRDQLEIVSGQVFENGLPLLPQRVSPTGMIVPERRRFRDRLQRKLPTIPVAGGPFPMWGFVVTHHEEGPVLRPFLEDAAREPRDDVGDVALVDAVTIAVIENRIRVSPLARQDLPVVESLGVGSKVPLPNHGRVIAGILHPMGHGGACRVNVVEDGYPVAMAVLPCEERCPARRADRIDGVAAVQTQTLSTKAVQVRGLVDPASIGPYGLGCMVIRHDEQDVRTGWSGGLPKVQRPGGNHDQPRQCERVQATARGDTSWDGEEPGGDGHAPFSRINRISRARNRLGASPGPSPITLAPETASAQVPQRDGSRPAERSHCWPRPPWTSARSSGGSSAPTWRGVSHGPWRGSPVRWDRS